MTWLNGKKIRPSAAMAVFLATFLLVGVTAGLTSASWWPGDSTAKDILSGKDAELVGGATYASGRISRSFSFQTSGSAVKLPGEVLDGFGDVSFEAWISTRDTQGAVFSAANGTQPVELALSTSGSDQLQFSSRGSSFQVASSGITSGEFHHVIWVRKSGGSNSVYVDGVLAGTGTLPSGDLSVDDNGLFLAQKQTGVGTFDASQQFIGLLDEVAIYAQALNARQVTSRFEVTRRDRLEEQERLRNQILNDKANELEALVEERSAELSALLNTRAAELTSLINSRSDSLDAAVANNYNLLFDTHQVDPFDMTLDICATGQVATGVGYEPEFGGGFEVEGKVGADVFGNGGEAKVIGDVSAHVTTFVGADAGLEVTACINPLLVRQSDVTADLASVRQEMLTALKTLGLMASDQLPTLAADAQKGTGPAQDKMKAMMIALAALDVSSIDQDDPLAPFIALANALPLPSGVKQAFDDPTSLVPLSLMPADVSELDKLCASPADFPFAIVSNICTMANTLGPAQALTAVQNLNAAVIDITSIKGTVGGISTTVGNISTSVGGNLKGEVDSIKGTVGSISTSVGSDLKGDVSDICSAVDDIEGISC